MHVFVSTLSYTHTHTWHILFLLPFCSSLSHSLYNVYVCVYYVYVVCMHVYTMKYVKFFLTSPSLLFRIPLMFSLPCFFFRPSPLFSLVFSRFFFFFLLLFWRWKFEISLCVASRSTTGSFRRCWFSNPSQNVSQSFPRIDFLVSSIRFVLRLRCSSRSIFDWCGLMESLEFCAISLLWVIGDDDRGWRVNFWIFGRNNPGIEIDRLKFDWQNGGMFRIRSRQFEMDARNIRDSEESLKILQRMW